MAAERTPSTPAEVTPTEAVPVDEAPVVTADPALVAPDSLASAPVAPVAPVAPAEVPALAAPVVASPAQQVVYVQAPKPFVKKGNRGFGVLIAILSAIIFTALYGVSYVVAEVIAGQPVRVDFVTTTDFYAAPVMFLIGFILLVLIVNRAGWAAHVLGSLFVGLFVFFGTAGALLLLNSGSIPSNQVSQRFNLVLFSTGVIVAGLLAREVALWMGFFIAARGRRVKVRNVDARVLYDQEIAAKRTEYEQANAASAARPTAVSETGPVAPVAETVPATETGPVEPVVATETPVGEAPVDEVPASQV